MIKLLQTVPKALAIIGIVLVIICSIMWYYNLALAYIILICGIAGVINIFFDKRQWIGAILLSLGIGEVVLASILLEIIVF